jgi:excisionase family DNA binding protein
MSAATEPALDLAGVAALLNVSRETAYRWARGKKIPGIQPAGENGKWLFYESEVRAHLSKKDPFGRPARSRTARRRAA